VAGIVDHILVARVPLTLVTIGYGFSTMLADLNKTHATNPAWTPHARFHVVWQISSYVGFGFLALCLIWVPGPFAVERLYLACIVGAIVYGAFFVAIFRDADLRRMHFRRQQLPTVCSAGADHRAPLGREHHRFLRSYRNTDCRHLFARDRLRERFAGPATGRICSTTGRLLRTNEEFALVSRVLL